jgi:hypothetical protein
MMLPIRFSEWGTTMAVVMKTSSDPLRTQPTPRVDGPGIIVQNIDPLGKSREMAAGVSQLIGAAVDIACSTVEYRITPLLSGVTVSWERQTLPSRQWLRDLEQEIITFGVCNGLQIWFREH